MYDQHGFALLIICSFLNYMNKFNQLKYFELNVNAPLFKALSDDEPEWWEKLKADSRVYINVRHGGYINVYFRGESIMKLEYRKRSYRAKINTSYLSDEEKRGKQKDMAPEDIVERLDEIIDRMQRRKPNGKPEGDSEEGLKGALFMSGDYIDTEFAYMRKARPSEIEARKRNANSSGTKRICPYAQDRIDLVRVDDGAIQYVELKRISDPRLNRHDRASECEAEIVEQMLDYQHILDIYKDMILSYYQAVQQVMKNLGIRNGAVNQEITRVSESVELYIAGYKDGKSYNKKRYNRIQTLQKLLKDKGLVCSNIDAVLDDYLKLRKV